ncbi:MAG: arginase [Alphaproteobacteria bacterium]
MTIPVSWSDADRKLPPIAILGVPVEAGTHEPGPAMGPAALRTAGLAAALRDLGHDVEDHGDVQPEGVGPAQVAVAGNARNPQLVAEWTRALSARAHTLMAAGYLPIFLGGDHTMAMGSINGVARHCRERGRDLFVLWLDAHADFNTPESSPSGNLHGMPVAMLCGEPGLDWMLGDEPRVPLDPRRMIQFGIRSVDRVERDAVSRRGVTIVDMRQIDEFGVPLLMRQVLDTVQQAGGVLHVSLDIDFLDPSIAPAVGTTVAGGATYREAHLIMEMLYDSGLVISLDVAELNPFLDVRGQSARLLVDLVASLMGRRIIGRRIADRPDEGYSEPSSSAR